MIPCTQLRWAMKKILMFLACFVFMAQVGFAATVIDPGNSYALLDNGEYEAAFSSLSSQGEHVYTFTCSTGFTLNLFIEIYELTSSQGLVNYFKPFDAWFDDVAIETGKDLLLSLTAGTHKLKLAFTPVVGRPGKESPGYELAVTAQANPVPLPAAAWLLGSALMGLVVARKRRS